MIFEKVQKLIAEQLNITDIDSIKPESNIVTDLHADSLDLVELIMSVEDSFNIVVPDEMANELTTVGAVVAYIESQQK